MRFVGIDPSTQTGIVILDKDGNLLDGLEITSEEKDPARIADLVGDTLDQLEPNDFVCIEGFGFASQSGFLLGGIGWGIRVGMYLKDIEYKEVAPAALKKYASGKGTTKKDELAVQIFKKWEFEHQSDNVRDAYVLAQIARALILTKSKFEIEDYHQYQLEVLEVIKNPKIKTKKKPKHKQ